MASTIPISNTPASPGNPGNDGIPSAFVAAGLGAASEAVRAVEGGLSGVSTIARSPAAVPLLLVGSGVALAVWLMGRHSRR